MGVHKITEDDVVNNGTNLQLQKERMRKANFRLPYTQNMNTEQSTYKNCISDLVQENALNEGRPAIMSNLKNASIKLGNRQNQVGYITEHVNQYLPKVAVTKSIDVAQQMKMKDNLKGHHFELGYGPNGHVLNTGMGSRHQSHKQNVTHDKIASGKDHQAHNFKLGFDTRPVTQNNVQTFMQKKLGSYTGGNNSVQGQYKRVTGITNG